jgi:uncharacterized peroxidase-related enzyme
MPFIATVDEADATGRAAEELEADRERFGYVPNMGRLFALRPEVYAAWKQLNGAIKASMDVRRYELATMAAAKRLRSTYCMAAHGKVLLGGIVSVDELEAIVADHRVAGLPEIDVAVMDLAEKVAGDAGSVTQADVDRLRALGLADEEIFDVVAAASVRCFFSKVLDALDCRADAEYRALDSGLVDALTVGRPVAE